MRIAVYENLPPGGALRTSYEIGRQLVARGHEVDLYRLSTYADKAPFDLGRDVRSVRVTPYRPVWGALNTRLRNGHLAPRSYTLFGPLRRVHRRLAEEILAGGYDAVLLHPDAMTHGPYVLRWLDRVPTVYYCQEPPRVDDERAIRDQHRRELASSSGVIGWLRLLDDNFVHQRLMQADEQSTSHAKVIAVNSVYSRERAWAAYSRNAVVCYLGVDPTRFAPGDARVARRREVLSVGSPVPLKGHELVLEAVACLPAKSRPALRVVLPRPGRTERIKRLARQLSVDLVIDSSVDDADIVERYQRAMVTVCAARLEPFGLTVVESMACGTPVVAIREGGYRESVVDGVTGILVEPEANGMAACIARLLDDSVLATRMGAEGRDDVLKRWTWKRTADQMESILQEAARQ